MEHKFRAWLSDHNPADDNLHKGSFWKEYNFWKSRIIPMFNPLPRGTMFAEYAKKAEAINSYIDIVGEHFNKGITHPVLLIKYKGAKIVIRYNFCDYEVAVISPKPLTLPMDELFSSRAASFFYQGFPEVLQLEGRYETNNSCFMASITDQHRFFTFMFLLKCELDK